MPTTLKVTLPDGSLKKIKVAKEDLHDFATFHNKLKDKFDVLENCTMNYTDEDGDVCLLDDDDSLEDAKTTMDKDTLRLVLKIKVRSHVPPLSAASSASAAVGGSEPQVQKRSEADAEALSPADLTEQLCDAVRGGKVADIKAMLHAEVMDAIDFCTGPEELLCCKPRGHVEAVKFLVEAGAEVNAKSSNGWTALMQASYHGRVETVKFLVEAGAEVKAKERDGGTALCFSSCRGHVETVKFLVEAGAEVNAKESDGKTPLMWASYHGHVEAMKFLIQAGAEVNAKSSSGWTALMKASDQGPLEAVKVLVEAGAEVNTKKANGRTALWFAEHWALAEEIGEQAARREQELAEQDDLPARREQEEPAAEPESSDVSREEIGMIAFNMFRFKPIVDYLRSKGATT